MDGLLSLPLLQPRERPSWAWKENAPWAPIFNLPRNTTETRQCDSRQCHVMSSMSMVNEDEVCTNGMNAITLAVSVASRNTSLSFSFEYLTLGHDAVFTRKQ